MKQQFPFRDGFEFEVLQRLVGFLHTEVNGSLFDTVGNAQSYIEEREYLKRSREAPDLRSDMMPESSRILLERKPKLKPAQTMWDNRG